MAATSWFSGAARLLGCPAFFAIAAQMMRRILAGAARSRDARRRDGIPVKVNLDAPRQAKVVERRYFGRLTEEEIEAAMKICPRLIRRDLGFR